MGRMTYVGTDAAMSWSWRGTTGKPEAPEQNGLDLRRPTKQRRGLADSLRVPGGKRWHVSTVQRCWARGRADERGRYLDARRAR
jgi:hypothetical protein